MSESELDDGTFLTAPAGWNPRPKPDAYAVVGTCDWGDCERPTVALRWSDADKRWLSVCRGHRGNAAMPLPGSTR